MAAHKRKVSDRQLDELWEAYQNGTITGGGDQINITVPGGTSIDPVGTIISFMGTKPPAEYLVCDGSEYNIQDYPQLAAHILTHFGSYNYFGGGEGTFCVPDLRGEFLRGTGNNSHIQTIEDVTIPMGSGANVGEHQHGTLFGHNYGTTVQYMMPANVYDWQNPNADSWSDTRKRGLFISLNTYNTGTDDITSFSARPTNTSVLYCIKACNRIYLAGTIPTNYHSVSLTLTRIGNICQMSGYLHIAATVPLKGKILGFPDGFKPCVASFINILRESTATVRLIDIFQDGIYNHSNTTLPGGINWFFCAPFTYITSDPYPEEEIIKEGESNG